MRDGNYGETTLALRCGLLHSLAAHGPVRLVPAAEAEAPVALALHVQRVRGDLPRVVPREFFEVPF